jgi:hypothetical protein
MHTAESIAGRIVPLRGSRVILDADLAGLYGVATRVAQFGSVSARLRVSP